MLMGFEAAVLEAQGSNACKFGYSNLGPRVWTHWIVRNSCNCSFIMLDSLLSRLGPESHVFFPLGFST